MLAIIDFSVQRSCVRPFFHIFSYPSEVFHSPHIVPWHTAILSVFRSLDFPRQSSRKFWLQIKRCHSLFHIPNLETPRQIKITQILNGVRQQDKKWARTGKHDNDYFGVWQTKSSHNHCRLFLRPKEFNRIWSPLHLRGFRRRSFAIWKYISHSRWL